MDYRAEITIKEDANRIYKALLPENITRERSELSISKKGDELIITINAKDAVALRATLNVLTQVLAVCSKMKKV